METLLAAKQRGGRPSRRDAAALNDRILDAATALFLERGFGATSIDALASTLRISKRTFYHRFRGKAELFEAVVCRLIARWGAGFDATPRPGGTREEILRRAARQILDVALSEEALALYRLVVAEASRFPQLAHIMHAHGTGDGITRIQSMLVTPGQEMSEASRRFAAEQFLTMVVTAPRRRALGLGTPLTPAEREEWVRATVALFLNGLGHSHPAG